MIAVLHKNKNAPPYSSPYLSHNLLSDRLWVHLLQRKCRFHLMTYTFPLEFGGQRLPEN